MTIKTWPHVYWTVNKPAGKSSAQFITPFKKAFRGEKVGHFGTLDPFAEGLLIVGMGSTLRLNQLLQKNDFKTYTASGIIGLKTDTGDKTGNIIQRGDSLKTLTREELKQIANDFIGEYWQIPPAFSAVKHNGKPLYEWARNGVFIQKPAVRREVYEFEILEVQWPRVQFKAKVSSGTYIRTLFEDLCRKFGAIGHLNQLCRSEIGEVSLLDCERDFNLEAQSSSEFVRWAKLNAAPIHHLFKAPIKTINTDDLCAYESGQLDKIENFNCADSKGFCWVVHEQKLLGLVESLDGDLKISFNLPKGS